MTYEGLRVERDAHIATVFINRPEKLNTLSVALMEALCLLVEGFRQEAEIRVVIFTGTGAHFSAGMDLSDPVHHRQRTDSRLMRYRQCQLGARMIRTIHEMDQLTIAAVNGYTLGGGACIASACDYRVGSESCAVGFPEVNLAMNLTWTALPLVVHLIGPARAKQMVILGRREKAETLKQWGWLDEVVAEPELLPAARRIAAAFAAQPPLAAQMVKRSINAIVSAFDRAVMHMEADQFLYATSGEDFQEALAALFEKRKGHYRGN
jgi:enoyl-CoA hydratase/carnithine racemase